MLGLDATLLVILSRLLYAQLHLSYVRVYACALSERVQDWQGQRWERT